MSEEQIREAAAGIPERWAEEHLLMGRRYQGPEGEQHFAQARALRKLAKEIRALEIERDQVQVKPLVWRGAGDHLDASALGLLTFYRITGEPGNWTLMLPCAATYEHRDGLTSQAAAKATAQADYEARVRAALVEISTIAEISPETGVAGTGHERTLKSGEAAAGGGKEA